MIWILYDSKKHELKEMRSPWLILEHMTERRVHVSGFGSRTVNALWAESVTKRRIGEKKITHSLAPLTPLRSVSRRTAPLHSVALRAAALRSAGTTPLRNAPLAALVRE